MSVSGLLSIPGKGGGGESTVAARRNGYSWQYPPRRSGGGSGSGSGSGSGIRDWVGLGVSDQGLCQ